MPVFQIMADTCSASYITIRMPSDGLEVQRYLQCQSALRRWLGRRLE